MYRYIALAWPNKKAEPAAYACRRQLMSKPSKWEIAFEGDGLVVLHSGDCPGRHQAYPVNPEPTGAGGVILGKLFSRRYIDNYQPGDHAPEPLQLGGRESRYIVDTQGRHLLQHYWGSYIAFILDPTTRTHFVLRDPSGARLCYFSQSSELTLYYSHPEDCTGLAGIGFSINWNYMAGYVRYHRVRSNQTGLREAVALLPGECRIVAQREPPRQLLYWDPIALSRCDLIETPELAAAELRRITIGCVTAWASNYTNVLLQLSGGFDSAVVLGCLKYAANRPHTTGLNHFMTYRDGDERALARLTADAAGCELFENPLKVDTVDYATLTTIPNTAEPTDYGICSRLETEARLAAATGAEVVFSGIGGDQVFFQETTSHGAIDYACRHGLGRRLFTVCMEAARLGHDCVWPVLFRAIKTGVFKLPAPRAASIYQLPAASFVRKEAVQSLDPKDFMHPFYLQPHRLPPAKASHVAGLLIPPLHLEQAHSDYFVNRIAPLCSQPLIELCLRIPTDVLTIGGKNRGLARRAFADLMPLEIATRESKSTSNSYQRNILSKQLPYARELLLEGVMVKEKLFDRKRLEQALTLDEKYDTSAFEHLAILRYMSTEIWLRSQLFD